MAQTPLAENQSTIYRGYDIVRRGSDYHIYGFDNSHTRRYLASRLTYDEACAFVDAHKRAKRQS